MSEHDDRFDENGAAEPARDELDGLLRAWHEENRQRAAAGRDRLLAALAAERAGAAGDSPEIGHSFAQMNTDGKELRTRDPSSPICENLCQSVAIPLPSVAAEPAAGEPGIGHRFAQMNTDGKELEPDPASSPICEHLCQSVAIPLPPVASNAAAKPAGGERRPVIAVIRRVATHRASRLVAALLALAVLLPVIFPGSQPSAAAGVVMVAQGGRLVAFAPDGEPLGPCVLKHTDVDVDIAGPFARVTLHQQYHNPNPDTIEAVYTFPMSHRAAVDRMKMVIGNRVIEGQVKERSQAQQIYAAARAAGRVASLLEQERPNIFTQSVANIEPGAEIAIEISYVEVLPSDDGQYTFSFPTTVAPRYIPGRSTGSAADEVAPLPEGCEPRRGLVLLAPPTSVTLLSAAGSPMADNASANGLAASLEQAIPIEAPPAAAIGDPALTFAVTYPDRARETGALFESGLGMLGGRWFYLPAIDAAALARTDDAGAPFGAATDEVPDAARITPTPAGPATRAGHDLSITVHIDTGGPGILNLRSPLHEIVRTEAGFRDDGVPRRATIKLKNLADIPNRDFVLAWKQTAGGIEDQVFTAAARDGQGEGGFFTLLLQPPQRVADEQAMPRELLFVLDVSGSMSGEPIAKAKDVLTRALASMRPQDRFNIIKFNNSTSALWDAPRAATEANLAAARAYFDQEPGGGGTEMMQAIRTALQMPRGEAVGDNRDEAAPLRLIVLLSDGEIGNDMAVLDAVKARPADTRFFTFSIGNSANRYLLDNMATLGGGKAAYVLQTTDAAAAVEHFARRINTPVLTNVKVEFRGVRVSESFPPLNALPDLYDVEPLVMHGRVARLSEPEQVAAPSSARIIITGMSGAGPWRKEIPFPQIAGGADRAAPAGHDQIATLWARANVESLLKQDLAGAQQGTIAAELKDQIVSLGERFNLLTQYTAFVAVDKLRVTVGGRPRLVNVPIELPNDATWEGAFGPPRPVLRQMPELGAQLEESRPRIYFSTGLVASATPELDADGEEMLGEPTARTLVVEPAADSYLVFARVPVIAGEAPPADLMGYSESWPSGVLGGGGSAAGFATNPSTLQGRSEESAGRYTFGGRDTRTRSVGDALYGDIPALDALSEAEQVVREQVAQITAARSNESPILPERQAAFGQLTVAPSAQDKKDESRNESEPRARQSAATEKPAAADAPREVSPATPEFFEAAAPPAPSAKMADQAAGATTDASRSPQSRAAASPAAAQPTPPLLSAIERTAAKIRALATSSPALAAGEDVGVYWSHPAFAPTLICELHVGGADAAGAPEIAAAFAEHFAALYPDDEILTALHATYQDDTLDAAALTVRVRELADESWENVLRIERLATLRRRLDPRLLSLVSTAATDQEQAAPIESLAPAAAAPTPGNAGASQPSAATLPTKDGNLLLSILVEDVAAARQPLTDAGAKILVTDDTMRLIVAAVAPERLADLAIADGVRRIEPATME